MVTTRWHTTVSSAASAGPCGTDAVDFPCTSQFDYDSLTSASLRRIYFRENGYIVRRGLLAADLCVEAIRCFEGEIKSRSDFFYRQASANPERHQLDGAGNVLNALLNPLSVYGRRFPGFRTASETVLSCETLFAAVEELMEEPAVLVQSMYFEANPATWPHQDSYYLDTDSPGRLLGAWIALEDIDERVGRFYVLPGSHRHDVGANAGNLSIGAHHDRYKERVRAYVRDRIAEIRAPALKRGDVLLWNSRTVHGASRPLAPGLTRHSYTAHFIPESSRFMQYECIPVKLHPTSIAGRLVCRPKDQDVFFNRCILKLEALTPMLFPRLKKAAIRHKIQRRSRPASRS